jgi:hypothetical protein
LTSQAWYKLTPDQQSAIRKQRGKEESPKRKLSALRRQLSALEAEKADKCDDSSDSEEEGVGTQMTEDQQGK